MTSAGVGKTPSAVVKQPTKTAGKPAKKGKNAKTASHPPYFQMIKEALLALNEKGGSSPYAIGKYMEEKHKLVDNFRKMLALQLKNSTAKGKLIKVKGWYKLCEDGKKLKATSAAKKPATAARATAGGTAGGWKKAVKGTPVKKMTPVKGKQPKSIKSPVKRARKITG